jgi:hypothetical protein
MLREASTRGLSDKAFIPFECWDSQRRSWKDSKSAIACLELGSLALAELLLIASYGRAVR